MTGMLPVSAFPDSCATSIRFASDPVQGDLSTDPGWIKMLRTNHAKLVDRVALLTTFGGRGPHTAGLRIEESYVGSSNLPVVPPPSVDDEHEHHPVRTHDFSLDRTVTSRSRDRASGDSVGSGRNSISTKDSIADLGLSCRSPSPSHRLLRDFSHSLHPTVVGNPPPRSSSLPASPSASRPSSSHLSPASTLSPSSPSSVTAMSNVCVCPVDVVIEQAPSKTRRHSARLSLSLPSPSRSSSPGASLDVPPNELATLRHKASSGTLGSSKSSGKVASRPRVRSHAEDTMLQPYSLMSLSHHGMLAASMMPPSSGYKRRKPVVSKTTAEKASTAPQKATTLALKRIVPRLRRSGSITTSEMLSPTSASERDAVNSSFNPARTEFSESATFVDGLENAESPLDSADIVIGADEATKSSGQQAMEETQGCENKTTVHLVVGGISVEQDVEQIIPLLREMKFTLNFKA